MAKQSGLGWTTASVDDSGGTLRAILNDFPSLQFSTPRGVQDSTGIDKSAMERILLLADFQITWAMIFNPTANASHDVFKTVPSTSVARTTTLTIAAKTLTNEVLYTDYALTRAQSGEFTATVPGSLADGAVPTWSG